MDLLGFSALGVAKSPLIDVIMPSIIVIVNMPIDVGIQDKPEADKSCE